MYQPIELRVRIASRRYQVAIEVLILLRHIISVYGGIAYQDIRRTIRGRCRSFRILLPINRSYATTTSVMLLFLTFVERGGIVYIRNMGRIIGTQPRSNPFKGFPCVLLMRRSLNLIATSISIHHVETRRFCLVSITRLFLRMILLICTCLLSTRRVGIVIRGQPSRLVLSLFPVILLTSIF